MADSKVCRQRQQSDSLSLMKNTVSIPMPDGIDDDSVDEDTDDDFIFDLRRMKESDPWVKVSDGTFSSAV
eukprot:scaffold3616_cov97-Skeletonema_dohrnii-CCMP3373.AAC.2